VFIKVRVKVMVLPAGAVKVSEGQAQLFPYLVTPAPVCDFQVPGEEREPAGPPQEPPGTTVLAPSV
jgi:hypothetical protein